MTYSSSVQLSPNSLNLFLECPCCFWLEKKKKIRRPPPYPYALNIAVDLLLKEEFDQYRSKGEDHPLFVENNIGAKLFRDQKLLNKWRSNFEGIRYFDPEMKATLFGAVDDVLEFPDGSLAPLDYKSTGSNVAKIYDRFQIQMDTYTYLLEMNGYKTPKKGYLAFYIVNRKDGFKNRLPFRKELHEIETNPQDVPQLFRNALSVLKRESPPPHSADCRFGQWINSIEKIS